MRFRFTPEDKGDLIDIQEYYLANAPHVAHDFVDELFDHLNFLQDNPTAGVKIKNGYRLCRMARFPYHIVYELIDDEMLILVLQIVHHKRHPDRRTQRLK